MIQSALQLLHQQWELVNMAKETNNLVVATFKCPALAKKAIGWARDESMDFDYFSPFPEHHLEDEYFEGKKRSPVRRITLLGAITGCLGAFLFTSWMSIDYPLRVSAKPILSYPAFFVIAFECTILLGALATMGALLHFCRLPHIFRTPVVTTHCLSCTITGLVYIFHPSLLPIYDIHPVFAFLPLCFSSVTEPVYGRPGGLAVNLERY